MNSQDAERQELQRAIALLGGSTRHARLLEYVGAKYFQHQEEQLTEFNIATEVFGRSASRFVATQDAVVRVEVHRLRKKLREIYDQDTRTQGLQISLPAGTYVPSFTPVPAPPPKGASEPTPQAPGGLRRFLKWPLYLSILIAGSVAVIGFVIRDRTQAAKGPAPVTQVPPSASPSSAGNEAATEIHLLSGYHGSEVIDNSGVRWTPDRYFSAGGEWSRDSVVRGTSRQFLFANWRTGEFSYDLPVAPGSYEMRLFFVSAQRVGEEKLSGFNVMLNGKPLLEAFDVGISANGVDIADETVFRDITPDAKGFIRLGFVNQLASPMLNAIELVPGTPGKLKPIRILTQPTSYVDHKGQRWRADDYYLNGFRSSDRRKVSGTDDPELFGAERFGHFRYAIPVDKRGHYKVILHFAEFYYGTQLSGGGVGSRVFHVFCNGQSLLRDFDIYKEGGSMRVVNKTFSNIQPSAQGKINLDFEPVVNNATVSGIEVLEESN